MLFKFTDANFCDGIAARKIKPVRACISRNDKSIKSKTGLNKNSESEYAKIGPGLSYGSELMVHKGEMYFLVLDNVYQNGQGFTLNLHWTYCRLPMIIKVGDIYEFENIEFKPASDEFSSSSYFWLDSLKRIMLHHPTLEIEIRGHVDGFKHENDSTYQIMSEQRAKAVFDYLVKNSIAPERLTHVGFGNTKMKYKYPDFSPVLHRKNRRVEIRVLEI